MIGRGPSQIDQASAAAAGGPLASLANGAADQNLEMNPGGTAPAWYTIAGDGSMSAGVFRLLAIGSSTLASLPVTVPIVRWIASVASPTLSQDAPFASGTNPNSIHLAPQPPNAGSTGTANGTPGSVSIDLAAPVSTGGEGALVVQRAGVAVAGIGLLPGGGYSGLWLLTGAGARTAANAVLAQGSGVTELLTNAYTQFWGAGTCWGMLFAIGSRGWQFGANSNASTFGGGDGIVGLSNAITVPTSNPTGGVALYSAAGALCVRGTGGAITQFAGAGQGTRNTHAGKDSADVGMCTVSVAGVGSTLYQWTVPTNSCGLLRADVCARMVLPGTGAGHAGDGQTVTLSFGYSDVAGAITLTALASTVVQTIGTPGAIAYAISAAGNVISLQVTDSYAGPGPWSIDHQCNTHLSAN